MLSMNKGSKIPQDLLNPLGSSLPSHPGLITPTPSPVPKHAASFTLFCLSLPLLSSTTTRTMSASSTLDSAQVQEFPELLPEPSVGLTPTMCLYCACAEFRCSAGNSSALSAAWLPYRLSILKVSRVTMSCWGHATGQHCLRTGHRLVSSSYLEGIWVRYDNHFTAEGAGRGFWYLTLGEPEFKARRSGFSDLTLNLNLHF